MKSSFEKSILCIEQIDIENGSIGGIFPFATGLAKHSPGKFFTFVGLTSDKERKLGDDYRVMIDQVEVRFIPVGRFSSGRKIIPNFLKIFFGIIYYKRKIPNFEIHVHRIELAVVARIILGRIRVLFIHNSLTNITGPNSDSFWRFFPTVFKFLERFALNCSEKVIVVPESDFSRISRIHNNVIRTFTWYDEELFQIKNLENMEKQKLNFVWIGRLERQKNPKQIIAIANALSELSIEFQIIIVGSGSLQKELEREINVHGLHKRVLLAGFIPRKELFRFLENSRAALMTSHYEGSSIVLKEILATGTPIIANRESDPDKLIEHGKNGFIVDLEDAKSYSHYLLEYETCSPSYSHNSVKSFQSKEVIANLIGKIFS